MSLAFQWVRVYKTYNFHFYNNNFRENVAYMAKKEYEFVKLKPD
jgi:hypothetical protein